MSAISTTPTVSVDCYHCGLPCPDVSQVAGSHTFCCRGCRTVYEILRDNGLQQYYDLSAQPGTAPTAAEDLGANRFAFLDDARLQEQLLDFDDGRVARAALRLPQIHCASCVWLLENLPRLQKGVRTAEVDFLRREVAFVWDAGQLTLRQLVEALARLGYEPEITLGSATDKRPVGDPLIRRIAVAGFCFANAMIFSLPEYLAGPEGLGANWQQLFSLLTLALSLPVLCYSSTDYLRGAWRALRRGGITIDVPIALGICVLFGRSLVDILSGAGPGYLDSFNGFVFFLLLGKLFQRNSFVALSFERDYRSYFPLAVTVRDDSGTRTVPVADLRSGDRLVTRHGELIPADSRLISSHGRIDFSYVTGESEPVEADAGDLVWAGGRVAGAAIELEVLREVSQSHLTRLWNQALFHGKDLEDLSSLANRVSRWFTGAVLLIAAATAAYWLKVEPAMAAHAVTSVLIVACPCALALSTPFTTGTALNLLARAGLFLREGAVVERLARTTTVVFDKTGTLTSPGDSEVLFDGATLSTIEQARLLALLENSAHPLSRRLLAVLEAADSAASNGGAVAAMQATDFCEQPGAGLRASVDGYRVCIGSRAWLTEQGVDGTEVDTHAGETAVHVAFDGAHRGTFRFGNAYRPGVAEMLRALRDRWPLYLLSGDNDQERGRLLPLFGDEERLRFAQSPEAKLQFVRDLENEHQVLMVGDGLNDAGALRQSSAGIAVSDNIAAFSPACDGILQADQLRRLPAFLRFARACLWIIAISFGLSLLYNLTGLAYAVSGALSPLVSALLMPLSSVTVIAFTAVATRLAARWTEIQP